MSSCTRHPLICVLGTFKAFETLKITFLRDAIIDVHDDVVAANSVFSQADVSALVYDIHSFMIIAAIGTRSINKAERRAVSIDARVAPAN